MTAPTQSDLTDYKLYLEGLYEFEDQDFEDDDDDEELYYYYDDQNNFEKLRSRDMPGTDHDLLITYLADLLRWLYRLQNWAVYRELNFYGTRRPKETPLYPDLALLKGQHPQNLISYQLGVTGPPPDLIVEVISNKTRRKDLYSKPVRYARWPTLEYFAYDPRPNRRNKDPRLSGWRLSTNGQYEVLKSNSADGRLWSNELEAWLVSEGSYLRLYTRDGQRLLTEAETLREQSSAERRRADKLAQLLRELGHDPDELL